LNVIAPGRPSTRAQFKRSSAIAWARAKARGISRAGKNSHAFSAGKRRKPTPQEACAQPQSSGHNKSGPSEE